MPFIMPISFTLRDYWNIIAKHKFQEHYELYPCIPLRMVDQWSLKINGILCFQWVCDMGWGPFLNLQEVVYEYFTHIFYANMVEKQKVKKINIFIKDKGHTLMPILLNEILEMLDEGHYITSTWGAISIEGYKLNKWMKKLTKGKAL